MTNHAPRQPDYRLKQNQCSGAWHDHAQRCPMVGQFYKTAKFIGLPGGAAAAAFCFPRAPTHRRVLNTGGWKIRSPPQERGIAYFLKASEFTPSDAPANFPTFCSMSISDWLRS